MVYLKIKILSSFTVPNLDAGHITMAFLTFYNHSLSLC